MADENTTNNPEQTGSPVQNVEELSWDKVETYQPVSTDASDAETVFSTRIDEPAAPAAEDVVETVAAFSAGAPAAGAVPASATEPAQAASAASAPMPAPTYEPASMPASGADAAGSPYAGSSPSPYGAAQSYQPTPTYMPAGAVPAAGGPGGPGDYVPQGAYPGTPSPAPQQPSGGGKAIAALVCGICAIVFSETVIVGLVLGILAVVLAGQAARQFGKNGKTTGAKVCGIVGIVFSILALVAYLVLFALGIALVSYMDDYYYDAPSYGSTTPHGVDEEPYGGESPESDIGVGPIISDDGGQEALDATLATLAFLDNDETVSYVAEKADEYFTAATGGLSLWSVDVDPTELALWMINSVDPDADDAIALTDGDTGTVFIDVEAYDMDEYMSEIVDLIEDAPNNATEDPEEAMALLKECAQKAMASADSYETSLAFDLVKNGDTWEIEPDSLKENLDLLFWLYTE